MSFTPEYEIIRDYVTKHKQICNSVKAMSSEEYKETRLSQLKELYSILLAKRQKKIRSSLTLRLIVFLFFDIQSFHFRLLAHLQASSRNQF